MVPTPTVPGPFDIRQTSPSDFPVFAAPNTAPTPCCPPNEVVIALSTSILIPDYSRFYQTPIQDFRGPTYSALGDGSLVTAALMHDIFSANIMLSLLVLLTTIFLRNTFVSGSYLRRTKVRRKVLFYLLFVSQVVACIGTIPQIFSFFKGNLDCSILIYTTNIAASISLSILMTGILGYKAYKCLENSMIVYGILVLFLIGSSVAMILDITHIQGIQRISGSCSRSGDLLFVRVYLIVQFAQSLFLSCCFLYAVWKSHGSPTVRGRISITLSMDGDLDVTDLQRFGRRGWLDYDPAKEQKLCVIISKSPKGRIRQYSSYDMFSRLRAFLFRRPLMAPSRPQSSMGEHLLADGIIKEAQETHRCISPVVSSHSRISQFIPNMQLFRQVIKDELCYTALITTTYVIFAVLSVIGSNFGNDIPVIGWIGLSWAVMSLLAVHSFGRVIHRHEADTAVRRAVASRSWPRDERHTRFTVGELQRRNSGSDQDEGDISSFSDPFPNSRHVNTYSRASRNSLLSESSVALSITRSPNTCHQALHTSVPPVCIPSPTAQFPESNRTTPLSTPL